MGPWGRAPPQSRSSGPPTRSSGTRHIPHRNPGNGSVPPPGAGVGPSPGGNEPEKKAEASELLQALSLLQRIMTPEDFVKYQVLVTPKSKLGKTREQDLADRVKSLQRLRTQEATHKSQIDKLELDLQRHRDMLQGVLSRIRVESEECDELRAQVAGEDTVKRFLLLKVILRKRKCTLVLWKRRVGMSLCSWVPLLVQRMTWT